MARFPRDGQSAEALLQNAEMALKRAKESGEKYLHYVKDMNAELLQRLSLEQKLRQALDERQYVLHYQPKVAVESGRIVGVEALLRWHDPDEGLVSPARFIPVLEDSGLIVDVGQWVLEQALADGTRWHAAGAQPVPIAVNVSNHQLRRKDFAETVLRILAAFPNWPVDVEITESALMDDLVGSARKLNRLKEAGVGIAIDDFGTGYSSLRQLSRLAVDSLKIDRSFIVGLASDPADMTIVSTIISLARAFDLTAVAEGVETHEQLKLLRLLKCHQIQGYLIAKPMPAEALGALLSRTGGLIDVDRTDADSSHSSRGAVSGNVK
jgi:EAL domain-containing protein (putative c-di-GMP-specific phosphodiesterase class I)